MNVYKYTPLTLAGAVPVGFVNEHAALLAQVTTELTSGLLQKLTLLKPYQHGAASLNLPSGSANPRKLDAGDVWNIGGALRFFNGTDVKTIAFLDSFTTVTAETITGTLPITKGGTGATTAPTALTNLGAAPLVSPQFSGTVVLPSTTSIGSLTAIQIGYLTTLSSNVQDQLTARVLDTGDTMTGTLTISADSTALRVNTAAGVGALRVLSSSTTNGLEVLNGRDFIMYSGDATGETVRVDGATGNANFGTGTVTAATVNATTALQQNGVGVSLSSHTHTYTTDTVSEGATNQYFTTERAQDAVGAMVTNSSSFTWTYNDTANTLAGAVVDNTSIQKVTILNNGTLVGSRKQINLIPSSNITYTIADNAVSDRVDVTINGSAAGVTGPGTATIGQLAAFNNATGSTLKVASTLTGIPVLTTGVIGATAAKVADLSDVAISTQAAGQYLRADTATTWANSAIQSSDLPNDVIKYLTAVGATNVYTASGSYNTAPSTTQTYFGNANTTITAGTFANGDILRINAHGFWHTAGSGTTGTAVSPTWTVTFSFYNAATLTWYDQFSFSPVMSFTRNLADAAPWHLEGWVTFRNVVGNTQFQGKLTVVDGATNTSPTYYYRESFGTGSFINTADVSMGITQKVSATSNFRTVVSMYTVEKIR